MKTKLSIAAGMFLATTQLCGAMDEHRDKFEVGVSIPQHSESTGYDPKQIFIVEEYDIDLDESGFVLGAEWNPNPEQWVEPGTPADPVPVTSKVQEDKHQVDFDLDESCFIFDRETRERHAKARANQITPVPYTSKTLEDRHPNDGTENIVDGFNYDRGEGLPYILSKNPSEELEYKDGHHTVAELMLGGFIRVKDNWIVRPSKPDSSNEAQDNKPSDK